MKQIEGCIYVFDDGGYYWLDETGQDNGPYTSIAAARIDVMDYGVWLETGVDLSLT